MTRTDEFDRQLENLIEKGFPAIAGLSDAAFTDTILPLRTKLLATDGDLPFAIVINVQPVARIVSALGIEGVTGFKEMDDDTLSAFKPIDGVKVPDAVAYLITDIDTGKETLNVAPDEALPTIIAASRSPLTIPEGLAVIAHYPDVLKTHNAFSMLASRSGDRRVPALWTSKKKPKFGWCWAGNPHTWLGSASCATRLSA